MKFLITAILLSFAWNGFAQNYSLEGNVFAEDGAPMVFSSVVLLNPADSTMQSFGITNKEGHFEIKNIKKGDYLLQVAFLGYGTIYKYLSVPVEGNNLGTIIMKGKSKDVSEVKVVGEYVPLAIKKDTVEYNANAFKLKPDAVAEDLLKKLPGIEVDRAGNIKAMGEDINKLFVDGKEFFGNDPKVATKNVPADAVNKVQVYDRKSEETMFTGIDDGSREKAINLQLKEDKKNALFGNVMAGGGTGEHWQGSAKAYRFTDKIQMAALGMANNVNQFGFSFDDYLNFNGGIAGMMLGSGSAQIRITNDGSFPVNFGQPVSGLNTSGAGGANFSYSTSPNDRIFISYLRNGSRKDLEETTKTWNYTNVDEYFQQQDQNETDKNQSHRMNFGLRNRIDSTQNIVVDGNLTLSNGDLMSDSYSKSLSGNTLVNQLWHNTQNNTDRLSGNANGSYQKMLSHGKSVFKVGGNINFSKSLDENQIENTVDYAKLNNSENSFKYQNNKTESMNYSANISLTQKLGKVWYFLPEFNAGNLSEVLHRKQGAGLTKDNLDNLLSPDFQKMYTWFRPKLAFKRTTQKSNFNLVLQLETGNLKSTLNDTLINNFSKIYVLPTVWYEYEYQTGRRLVLNYSTRVNTPTVTQLLPVENNLNPLSIYYGNPNLQPEFAQNINMNWMIFDQFSFTSFMATVNGTITNNKINWDRTINDDLSLVNTLTNVKSDYNLRGNIDFSTPIRRLGMKIHINVDESWTQGLNIVNSIKNKYTNISHRASFSVDNRKKEKWDVNTGVEVTLTYSKYSVQKSLNNRYFNMSWFGDVRFTPNNHWNFEANADVANYTNQSFGESVHIPLLGAEISRYFLKNNRGTLTLKGFDLLNKNTIVNRFSELNYLREIRSNSIGRFVMLSFTYRLNKFGNNSNGIEVKMGR